jgi:hypothetical protein
VLAAAQANAVALTFTWAEAHDRGAGTSIKYRFRLAAADNAEKYVDFADEADRTVTFTHEALNNQLVAEWNANPDAQFSLKATVAAEVQGASVQMKPELSEVTVTVTPYGERKNINGTELESDDVDGILYHADLTLTQNQPITIGGFDLSDWRIDEDFLEPTGGQTFKFLPIGGKYRFIANFARKYFRIQVMNGNSLASLQNDGSGAMWVYGPGIGKPWVEDGVVDWEPNDAQCLAPIGNHKYQLTGVVGERFNVNGTSLGLAFSNTIGTWAKVVRPSLNPPFNDGSIARYATITDPLILVDNGDNIHPKYQGALLNGGKYRFTLDATDILNVVITVEALNAPTAPAITINGTAVTAIDFYSFKADVTLTQGQPVNIVGAEGYWLDPDFIDDAGKLIPMSGTYRVIGNSQKQYFIFILLNSEGNPSINPNDLSGPLWLLGNYIGKPSLAVNQTTFDEGKGLPMARISATVFRISFVAGQSIMSNAMNMKIFGQNGWGFEFAGAGNMTRLKGEITTSSTIVDIAPTEEGGNLILKGTTDEQHPGTPLVDGKTYVFTVTVNPTNYPASINAVLDVEMK